MFASETRRCGLASDKVPVKAELTFGTKGECENKILVQENCCLLTYLLADPQKTEAEAAPKVSVVTCRYC